MVGYSRAERNRSSRKWLWNKGPVRCVRKCKASIQTDRTNSYYPRDGRNKETSLRNNKVEETRNAITPPRTHREGFKIGGQFAPHLEGVL